MKRGMPLRDPIRLTRDPPAVRLRMRKYRRHRIGFRRRIRDPRQRTLNLRRILSPESRRCEREGTQYCANRRDKLESQTPHLWYPKFLPPEGQVIIESPQVKSR